MFDQKPLKNRLISTIDTSTRKAMVRYRGAPKSATPLPPPAQLIPTCNSVMPMAVMIVPVTTGGKNRSILLKNGAISTVNRPDAMTAPRMVGSPVPALAMATIGPTAAKVTPIMTGRRMPNFQTPML